LKADLREGSDSHVHVLREGAERLVAEGGMQTLVLDPWDGDSRKSALGVIEDWNRVGYVAQFDTDAEGTRFAVALERGARGQDAPLSQVTMPAPFQLSGPSSNDVVLATQGTTIAWEASELGDVMRYRLTGQCLVEHRSNMPDTGALVLGPEAFEWVAASEDRSCPTELCVDRVRHGALDPAYRMGGTIDAVQHRCVTFQTRF
jgi:hypothetical protein